ncbi:MAG: nicotinate-nucleotide adenylyltransferase [Firmicutes bacterium]|nr:nicotinate-nucleotide adenylyltransferase [Bacillota bacterium]
MERVGIFGGSFDPVHSGHLLLAEQLKEAASLDRVIFIPARTSPFKLETKPTSGEDRLEMIRLAIAPDPDLSVSDMELQREGPSYTADTLEELKKRLDGALIYFILGSDAFMGLDRWYKAEELIMGAGFLVGMRKGDDPAPVRAKLAELKERFEGCDIELFDIPELELSSSDIRFRHQGGRSIVFMVPEPVRGYIEEKGLYTGLLAQLEAFAVSRQSDHRLAHTRGVVACAERYALRFGADPFKAKAAAWFHDNYKEEGALQHGPKAAEELGRLFGISDEDTLNAIRYHTTGRPGMSLLEIVVKMADLLEPGRSYPGAERLRAYADECDDPEEIMLTLMREANESLIRAGKTPAKISTDAISYFENKLGSKEER